MSYDVNFQKMSATLNCWQDEKKQTSKHLKQRYSQKHFHHILDIGAADGTMTSVLSEQADKLTLVEVVPEYREILARKFPKARVVIDSADRVMLETEYDLILFSHVLYYFAQDKWFGLVKKLYDALVPGGELVLVLMKESGAWWEVFHRYHTELEPHLSFSYFPLRAFKQTLLQLGAHQNVVYPTCVELCSEKDLVDWIGKEVLQIEDEEVLQRYAKSFQEFGQRFERKDGKIVLQSDIEMIVIRK